MRSTVIAQQGEERHHVVHENVALRLDLRKPAGGQGLVVLVDGEKAGLVEALVEEVEQRNDLGGVQANRFGGVVAEETKQVDEAELHDVAVHRIHAQTLHEEQNDVLDQREADLVDQFGVELLYTRGKGKRGTVHRELVQNDDEELAHERSGLAVLE